MIQVLQVGECYSSPNPHPGSESIRAEFSSTFVDIVYYIRGASPADLNIWKRTPIRYGLFEAVKGIPFLLLDFVLVREEWNLDVPLNVLKMDEEAQLSWLSATGNLINAILIDTETNRILAMRQLTVSSIAARQVRDSLTNQLVSHTSSAHIDAAQAAAADRFSTAQMVNKTTMFHSSSTAFSLP